ncbi:hypothetical protein F2P81_011242 [Scophthalmus maximus]|uniref:SOWAHA-C winged helix-turn-helix domain-containing protein n=1 Tax=Scophthalmus maximus TaxID=52904 RepID=A0A6A4SVN3_SCOMX|nr:hypothetical protein F2P81_011242 [Scophthalmus maximus]
MGDVSEEALLDYFSCAGGDAGRVRNADMLRTFKPFIGHGDSQLRAKYREEFKLIIDRIAVVKSDNGEKYLVLKKKYRQLLHERDPGRRAADGQKHLNPAGTTATVQWDAPNAAATPPPPPPPPRPRDELMSCVEPESAAESESEQDEEGTGSMGSAAVALDPIEKEWIYSAAGARVPDLSQLLRQDPSLANKKGYTPLHIAALHGHRHILDLLIETYGAKEDLRDYSGHLAGHYLNIREPEGAEEDCELQLQVTQARERNRNRKLGSLFHSKKKWGSAEELAPIEEERTASHQLAPPPFRPRKFSR